MTPRVALGRGHFAEINSSPSCAPMPFLGALMAFGASQAIPKDQVIVVTQGSYICFGCRGRQRGCTA